MAGGGKEPVNHVAISRRATDFLSAERLAPRQDRILIRISGGTAGHGAGLFVTVEQARAFASILNRLADEAAAGLETAEQPPT